MLGLAVVELAAASVAGAVVAVVAAARSAAGFVPVSQARCWPT